MPKILYSISAESAQGTRALKDFGRAQKNIATGATKVERSFVKSRNAAQQFQAKLKGIKFPRHLITQFEKLRNTIRANGAETQKFGGQLSSMGEKARTLGADLAVVSLAVGAVGGGSIKSAAEFESQFTKIRTLVLGVDADTTQLAEDVKNLSVAAGIGPAELADAMFVVTSAGARGADVMDILSRSAKAAALGLGETETIARAVTGAMQAFKQQGLNAADAVDTLVATVREGNLEAADLAGSLGRVGAIASQAGLTFQDVGGFIASFTRAGVSAQEAVTALRGVITGLLKPADQAAEAFGAFGTSAGEVRKNIKEKGLASAMIELITLSDGNAESMAAMIPNVRALAGVLATAGAQGESFVQIEKNIKNATGILNEGFEELQKDTAFMFKSIVAELHVMAIEFGDNFLPIIKESVIPAIKTLVGWLGSIVDAFGEAPPFVQKLIFALGTLVVAIAPLLFILGTLIKVTGTLTVAFGTASKGAGIFAMSLRGLAVAAGPVAAVIGVALAAVAIGRLIANLEISGRSIDDWILKWRGFPDIEASNDSLAESTERLADVLKNEYNIVIDQGRLSVGKWNEQVVKAHIAATKQKEELIKLTRAQAEAARLAALLAGKTKNLTKQTDAAAKAEATLLKKFSAAVNPAKKLAAEIKVLQGNKESASDIAKVYGKQLLGLEKGFDQLDPAIRLIVKDLIELAKKNRDAEAATKKNEEAQKAFREEMKALDRELKKFPLLAKEVIRDFGRMAVKGAKLEDMSRILGGRLAELEDHLEELPPDIRATVRAYIDLIKKHDKATEAAKDQIETVEDTKQVLEDLRRQIPNTITEFNNLRDAGAEDNEIFEIMGDRLIKLIKEADRLGIELPDEVRAMGELAEQTKKSAEEGDKWAGVWTEAMGNVAGDFATGIADMIFSGKSLGDKMKGSFKEMGKSMTKMLVLELFEPVGKMFTGLMSSITNGLKGLFSGKGFGEFKLGNIFKGGKDGGIGGFFKGGEGGDGEGWGGFGGGFKNIQIPDTGKIEGWGEGGFGQGFGRMYEMGYNIPVIGQIGKATKEIISALINLMKKSPEEKALNELGRDFSGLSGSQQTLNDFIRDTLGLQLAQVSGIRKETNTLFALLQGLSPEATEASQDALISALGKLEVSEAVGKGAVSRGYGGAFTTDAEGNYIFDLSEAARSAIESGNVALLGEQLTQILGASDRFRDLVPNFEEIITSITSLADESDRLQRTWDKIDESTQNAITSFIQTGVLSDELKTKFDEINPALSEFTANTSEQLKGLQALQVEFAGLGQALADLLPKQASWIEAFLRTGDLTDEIRTKINELGGDVSKFEAFQEIVRQAEAAGLELAEFIASNEAAQAVVIDLQSEVGGLTTTLAEQIEIMSDKFVEAINLLIAALGDMKGAAADAEDFMSDAAQNMQNDIDSVTPGIPPNGVISDPQSIDTVDPSGGIPIDPSGSSQDLIDPSSGSPIDPSGSSQDLIDPQNKETLFSAPRELSNLSGQEFIADPSVYQVGGRVKRSGMAFVHANEFVLTPPQTQQFAAATAMFESIASKFADTTSIFAQGVPNIRPRRDTRGTNNKAAEGGSSPSLGGMTITIEGSTIHINGGANMDRTELANKLKEIMDRNSEQAAEVIARRVSRILSTIEVD